MEEYARVEEEATLELQPIATEERLEERIEVEQSHEDKRKRKRKRTT